MKLSSKSVQVQRGGERPNSGRKKKYGEDTKLVTMRIPISRIDKVKKLVKNYLETL